MALFGWGKKKKDKQKAADEVVPDVKEVDGGIDVVESVEPAQGASVESATSEPVAAPVAEQPVSAPAEEVEDTQEGAAREQDEAEPAPTAESSFSGTYDRAQDGPFDISEKPGEDLLDLGGLRVEGFEGMELRMEMNQQDGSVVGLSAISGQSQMQVHPYAAPRTAGVWADIRREIAESVRESGGTAEAADGELGTQLDVQLPQQMPDGSTALVPMRFYGVDGPRWFVRGLLVGEALTDDAARTQLVDWFRGLVVVRGDQPMPPRDLLPLHLPEGVEEATQSGTPLPTGDDQPESTDDLTPFERGPEITEIR